MTNGEKIKEILPYLESDDTDLVKVLNINNLKSWWNAVYKEPTNLSSELEKNSKKLEKDFGELDCISRQAVLDLIADYDLSMGQVVRGIHALPPVTPQELKTGYWIEHPHEAGANWEFSMYECSECHVWEEDDSNYCPNCGAFCGGDNNG